MARIFGLRQNHAYHFRYERTNHAIIFLKPLAELFQAEVFKFLKKSYQQIYQDFQIRPKF
jgi:hypothetical protein